MPARCRPTPVLVAALAALILALTACDSGDPALRVGRAQASVPVAGSSQVVVAITNDGDGRDRLVGADTEVALGVELHRTVIEDGRAAMIELDHIEVHPGETLRFQPGDLHLMLVVPDDTVVLDASFELTLRFDRSGELTIPVEVVDLLDLVENDTTS